MTLVLAHDACLAHDVGDHPECPARVKRILTALQKRFPTLQLTQPPLGTQQQLLSFHSKEHVDQVLGLCAQAGKCAHGKRRKKQRHLQIDEDTLIMAGTRGAALRAVGACCRAVDLVMTNVATNAYCVVRPPGHHAEPDKAMGFCFFNNVAIGVLHAQQRHGVGRVAVIDFDVHHGNGTQAGFEQVPNVLYASTHQYDGEFYPGTGSPAKQSNIFNVPLAAGAGTAAFRDAFREVLSVIDSFTPELLMISCGFDAHADDPLAELNLTDNDFAWASAELTKLAEKHCNGRLVSVLEGGYDLGVLARCSVLHVEALVSSSGRLTAALPQDEAEELTELMGSLAVAGSAAEGHLPVLSVRAESLRLVVHHKKKRKPLLLTASECELNTFLEKAAQKLQIKVKKGSNLKAVVRSGSVLVTDLVIIGLGNDTEIDIMIAKNGTNEALFITEKRNVKVAAATVAEAAATAAEAAATVAEIVEEAAPIMQEAARIVGEAAPMP